MSMQSVALINYGSGNLRSAEKALIRAADGTSDGLPGSALLSNFFEIFFQSCLRRF